MRFENPERRLTMKTLADLEAIRKQMLDKVTMRKEDEN